MTAIATQLSIGAAGFGSSPVLVAQPCPPRVLTTDHTDRHGFNAATRTLLVQVLRWMKKARPPVLTEFRDKVELLQKEKPLPSPAHDVIQPMLTEALAA